jgi:hypothetical protein
LGWGSDGVQLIPTVALERKGALDRRSGAIAVGSAYEGPGEARGCVIADGVGPQYGLLDAIRLVGAGATSTGTVRRVDAWEMWLRT